MPSHNIFVVYDSDIVKNYYKPLIHSEMDSKKIMTVLGSVLTVTAGVLVAFQVQTFLAKKGVEAPQTADE